jgi:hypothetical protein
MDTEDTFGGGRREHSILQWHLDGFGISVLDTTERALQVRLAYVSLGVIHQIVYFNATVSSRK